MKPVSYTNLLSHFKELAQGSEATFTFDYEPRDFLDELMKMPCNEIYWDFDFINKDGCKISVMKATEPKCGNDEERHFDSVEFEAGDGSGYQRCYPRRAPFVASKCNAVIAEMDVFQVE